jgi:hypothetical protein
MADTLESQVRRKSAERIGRSREKVDDYVITASITIIAAFVVLLSVREASGSRIGAVLGAVSITSLTLGLLAALWHRYRAPMRQARFELLEAERIGKASGDILEFWNMLGKLLGKQGTPGPVVLPADVEDHARKTIGAHLQVMGADLSAIRRTVLSTPLPERHGRLNHSLDVLAERVRYPAFLAGMITFLCAIIVVVLKGSGPA